METLKVATEKKAAKDYRCMFCTERITTGSKYITSTHKYDGEVYDFKTHTWCAQLAHDLKMYDQVELGEGLTGEGFQQMVHDEHDEMLIKLIPSEDRDKYSDIIQQICNVRFHDKLWFIIRKVNEKKKLKENHD